MKPRLFISTRKCADNRTLVVVGEWKKRKETRTKIASHGMGTLTWKEPFMNHSLTLAKAICHPHDEFNEEMGIKLAMKRIKKGDDIGKLSTEDYTMLTPDHCQMIVDHKADYIASNIEHYLPKEEAK